MTRHRKEFKEFLSNTKFLLWLILSVFLLFLLTRPTLADEEKDDKDKDKNDQIDLDADWREGYEGHGTTHEQMGQSHWPDVEYTKYESNPQYARSVIYPTYGMSVVFNASHFLLDNILYEDPAIPPGYIVVQGEDTLALGPKVEANDWHDLVAHYLLILFWLFLLLVIIILLPFVA